MGGLIFDFFLIDFQLFVEGSIRAHTHVHTSRLPIYAHVSTLHPLLRLRFSRYVALFNIMLVIRQLTSNLLNYRQLALSFHLEMPIFVRYQHFARQIVVEMARIFAPIFCPLYASAHNCILRPCVAFYRVIYPHFSLVALYSSRYTELLNYTCPNIAPNNKFQKFFSFITA